MLTRADNTLEELSKNISDLKKDVVMCSDCCRFFEAKNKTNKDDPCRCKICSDQTRDGSVLMVVQRDVDLESVEKNGGFKGIYFVLGGSIPILEKEPEKRVRTKELKIFLERKINSTSQGFAGLKEIILGVNWNPEGENTADYVKRIIESALRQAQGSQRHNIKISTLGKGLSMGTELEYADSDTLKNALRNRI